MAGHLTEEVLEITDEMRAAKALGWRPEPGEQVLTYHYSLQYNRFEVSPASFTSRLVKGVCRVVLSSNPQIFRVEVWVDFPELVDRHLMNIYPLLESSNEYHR